jgi:hypothetical protein
MSSHTDDDVARSIKQKIEREKALINAANTMRQSTNNPAVLQGLDTKIRDGRKNIEYLEGRLRDHQMKQMNSALGDMGVTDDGYGGQYGQQGEYGDQQYGQGSGSGGMMPPSAPFARSGPGAAAAKRANFSKLGKLTCLVPTVWRTRADLLTL